MFGKKGELGILGLILVGLAVISILLVILVNATDLGISGLDISTTPEGGRILVETLINVATPFVEIIFALVAPVGQDENVQMIAFGIFLLLVLVGTNTLKYAFAGNKLSGVYAFSLSFIVGLIASRSLTEQIIKDTGLAASPVATAAILLAFIPIFGLVKGLERTGWSNWSKMAVYAVVGSVFWAVFHFAFEATLLGGIYAIGIVLIGTGEAIFKIILKKKMENGDKDVGKFLAWAGDVEETAKRMKEGSGK